MKRTAMQHTKLKRLVRALKVPQYAAVGILESLWHLTAREAPEGNIGKLSNEDIAIWMDWEGEADVLIGALVSCGWLDECSEDRLMVHDWHEHADDATKKAIDRQKKKASENGGNVPTVADKERLPEPLPVPEPKPEPKTKAAVPAFVLPEWIDKEAWGAWEEMRRKSRKPLTDHARLLAITDLLELKHQGHSPRDVLNQSVKRGWGGLFEIKGGSRGTNQGNQSRGSRRVDEAIEELRKAGVTIPSGRAENGADEVRPAAGGSDGRGSPGVVLEGAR